MANRVIPPYVYDALVAAFRKAPGNYSNAAKVVGVTRKTATAYWVRGHLKKGYRSIKEVLDEEALQARAQVEAKARQETSDRARAAMVMGNQTAEEARSNAIAAKAQEGKAVQMARSNAMALMAVTSNLLRGAVKLSEKMRVELEKPGNVDVHDASRLVRATALMVQNGNLSARVAMDMERLHLGDPDKAIPDGVVPQVEDMTPEEAIEEIKAAGEAAQRAMELGLVLSEEAATRTLTDDELAVEMEVQGMTGTLTQA